MTALTSAERAVNYQQMRPVFGDLEAMRLADLSWHIHQVEGLPLPLLCHPDVCSQLDHSDVEALCGQCGTPIGFNSTRDICPHLYDELFCSDQCLQVFHRAALGRGCREAVAK
jgi:hypothetical protein